MTKEQIFTIDKEKLVESLSLDWANGDACVTKWIKHRETEGRTRADVNNLTDIILPTFDSALRYAGGEGGSYECLLFHQGCYNIVIRLVPIKNSTSRVWIYER